ncbi:MAG TPA: hypothetical protein VK421_20695, partial [Pyrinomonadaceae bacterium]|nr:hypothetical protein [Pyrinomonadaceae bacterium]
MTSNYSEQTPAGWLAFELSVLRRLSFRSVVSPLCGEPDAEVYLKRWGVRVAANDPARWAWVRAAARVENNSERLAREDLDVLLEDVYVPGHRLRNPALARHFGEVDAWWFDNFRANADRLASDAKRALALDLGMMVGDYALSFDEETRDLRQPLSRVLLRLSETRPAPFDNRQRNAAANKDARQFLSEQKADLLFLRLPPPARAFARDPLPAWREEFVRGGADFWPEFAGSRGGWLGTRAETRQQFL